MNTGRSLMACVSIAALLLAGCVPRSAGYAPAEAIPRAQAATPPLSLSDYIRQVRQLTRANTLDGARRHSALADRSDIRQLLDRIETDPADGAAAKVLAGIYLEEGLPQFAYPLYQAALENDANDGGALLGLARIWKGWGDPAASRRYAERAARLAPSVEAFDLLGRIHLEQNRPGEAAEAFLEGLHVDPSHPVLLANAGYASFMLSDWPQAIGLLDRALELDPELVEARNMRGVLLAQMGERNAALEDFLHVAPEHVALNNVGVAVMGLRPTEAVEAFERAIALAPGYRLAAVNLALVRPQVDLPSIVDLPPFESCCSREEQSTASHGERGASVAQGADINLPSGLLTATAPPGTAAPAPLRRQIPVLHGQPPAGPERGTPSVELREAAVHEEAPRATARAAVPDVPRIQPAPPPLEPSGQWVPEGAAVAPTQAVWVEALPKAVLAGLLAGAIVLLFQLIFRAPARRDATRPSRVGMRLE